MVYCKCPVQIQNTKGQKYKTDIQRVTKQISRKKAFLNDCLMKN